jgi:hypothetical protein
MGKVPFISRSVRRTFFTVSVPLFIASVSLLALAHFRHGAFTHRTLADIDFSLTVCLIYTVIFSMTPCVAADIIARSRTDFKLSWRRKVLLIFACVTIGLAYVYILLVKFGFPTIIGVPADDMARYITRFLWLSTIVLSVAAMAVRTTRNRRSQADEHQEQKHV